MRTLLLLGWAALPIAGVAYHYGPGQDRLRLDDVAALVASAEHAAAANDFATAVDDYDAALKQLPAEHTALARRLRLERSKALMNNSGLPNANKELAALVDELAADATADPALVRDGRRALASSQFYMTWLLRLEGKGREEWEPQVEAARQNYRMLAETAAADGRAAEATKDREDLEATIRLARIQIEDLKGLPLPSQ